ncbi:uncharacterized protein LOC144882700 [Branchiostoma floridae x Branchiostoma japonicum]
MSEHYRGYGHYWVYKSDTSGSKDTTEGTDQTLLWELFRAAGDGDVETVKRLIQQRVDVNCVGNFSATPLRNAASGGHVGVAELLLKAGAWMDKRDFVRDTPLHAAAEGGHVGVAELLLKTGARVDSKDVSLATPLHRAASGGHVGVVNLLLKAAAQVDSGDGLGATPLHFAAIGGHVGVAELLLKAGAPVDSKDRDFRTPKDIAESTDVPFEYSSARKARILDGRKKILQLFAMLVG